MAEYIDKSAEVHEGYLTNWFIESVAEYNDERLNEPRWTEAHIEELTNDFIVIPKDTPAAKVAPVVRCSDCIFQGFLDSDYSGCFCEQSREEIQPNDFCSHAVSWEQHKASLGGSKMDEEVHNG